MTSPYFTVFTPTYNRVHTLHRVYDSLLSQTFRNFEWLIVDDGSVDETRELIEKWQEAAPFEIRYLYQENKGKHVASNLGVREAKGELFLFLDSDDACIPETLERFYFHWNSIPEKDRNSFSTLSALCVNAHGQVIGEEYPAEIVDVETTWHQLKMRASGERWGVNRTAVLRLFPFPEVPGEKFISEGIVWNRMARQYKARFVNEKLRLYIALNDGLSASSIKIRANSPTGTRQYYKELSELNIPYAQKAKAIVNYIRFSFHGGISIKKAILESGAPVIALGFLIGGYLLYMADKHGRLGD
jgi:glycosyltransferase involved in cell wall biosynthesis